MGLDDVAWEPAEKISDNWLAQFLELDILRPIADFILTHNRGNATELPYSKRDATVVRFSQPGAVLFPEEKVMNEVAVMRFLADQTSIPIPFVLHSVTKKENEDVRRSQHARVSERGTGFLHPNINEDKIEMLYSQLAAPSVSRIGSLSQMDDFTWEVTRRQLSMNMKELVRLGGLPRSKLPDTDTTYNTTSSYFEVLADLNIEHLVPQRNDAVESADDCRRKFVARQRLTNPSLENGPFGIWCDDLRPANVLLNENMQIVGVVDWEFTYPAPAGFTYAPPWWLLIEKPEYRLKTFLRAMEACEDIAIQQGRLKEDQRLSGPMQRSRECGDFWIMYAVSHSFAFDAIYSQKIDPRLFGPH
ncbi:uncharacterized protein P174DRAFT_511804 [Aspergillus novofumigatus IBT 16806]|uniref:Aminoglycoside phosphotransferase domain-containing protein n=1 Tax=Aspergillus novofumigatus (strain IBT 16806) TaxID=1392255 RepID=A0A2I1CEY6_ASPN1|nr:uncharacterized protein P174DRAFT_511804 [Aspergillus novofumigatus IBT 16806]PKX96207.1 hypothetical protein P174DRAFT_511804 [Aspergillus novofumigatus IBT 16806]